MMEETDTVYYQRKWDTLLIEGWRRDYGMGRLVNTFCTDLGIDSVHMKPDECVEFLEQLQIKRWRCAKTYGVHFSQPIRGFVASHSNHLNSCLMCNRSEGNSDAEILAAIGMFKWTNKIKRAGKPRKKRGPKRVARVWVPMRSGDKKHDWDTVK
jgi:hypothetical protein